MNINQLRAPDKVRPKAKFVTVVWGEAYIRRFAALSLPSFLAPGNLPALADATDLEVVIMTRSDDAEYFDEHPAFRRLGTTCAIRFVAIDDLITTAVYGVTLTLAYARAVIHCGPEMLNTHFVFMNADFVLADGSLRGLCKHIVAGRSIVLGPSFRATAEAVEPCLEALVDTKSGVLVVPTRELVALSLAHPHPTTSAKIVNQGFCHSKQPNQFFWQVDDQTLLGRYYLIFMLCLKPERVITSINCFCDYSFVPEMCPSGDEVAMDDSDEFFMLELQRRDQELHLLQIGRQTNRDIVRSLGSWTTAEHRRAARYNIVFHTGDRPLELEAAKAEARAFVERLEKHLGPPVPHERHRFWIRGVQAWRQYRKAQGLPAWAPELGSPGTLKEIVEQFVRDPFRAIMKAFWATAYAARHSMLGRWPRVTPLHPSWTDSKHLRDTVAEILADTRARVLVVRNEPEFVDPLFSPGASVQFAKVNAALDNGFSGLGYCAEGFTHVLVYLLRKDCNYARRIVAQCDAAMAPGGVCYVFVHHLYGEAEQGDFSNELVAYADDILPVGPWRVECSFVGGLFKRFSQRLINRSYGYFANYGVVGLVLALPLIVLWLPFTLSANLYLRIMGKKRDFVRYCSSVSIRLTPLQGRQEARGQANAPGKDPKLNTVTRDTALHDKFAGSANLK